MQLGWECNKCHNVYAPNVPFCLYCWFNKNNTSTSTSSTSILVTALNSTSASMQERVNSNINTDTIINPQKEKVEAEIIEEMQETQQTEKQIKEEKEEIKEQIEEKIKENQAIERVDIKLPSLNKEPNYPLSKKWPDTKIFLSGIAHSKERAIARSFRVPYVLDSIMDFPTKPSKLIYKYFDHIKETNSEFLLDSGAFTLMRNKHKKYNLNDLISKYCFYINEFDIQNFFELDLDELMPIEDVEELRKKIYLETHKMPIIVWHRERNKEYWTRMCKENTFIAIGGMAHRNSQKVAVDIDYFQELVDEAHTYNTKVHGLGFTPLQSLNAHTIFFDTVDSTTWNGGKHGISFALEGDKIKKVQLRDVLFASESIEKDLEVWSKFCEDYRGAMRI